MLSPESCNFAMPDALVFSGGITSFPERFAEKFTGAAVGAGCVTVVLDSATAPADVDAEGGGAAGFLLHPIGAIPKLKTAIRSARRSFLILTTPFSGGFRFSYCRRSLFSSGIARSTIA